MSGQVFLTRYNRDLTFASTTECVTTKNGSFDRHIVYLSIYNRLFLAFKVMHQPIYLEIDIQAFTYLI